MSHLGHMILFEHSNFDGNHRHVIDTISNFNNVSGGINDQISSIVILDGTWDFFRDVNFTNRMATLGVGDYPDVTVVGIANDSLSSVRLVASS